MATCSFNLLLYVSPVKLKFPGQRPCYRPHCQPGLNFLPIESSSVTEFGVWWVTFDISVQRSLCQCQQGDSIAGIHKFVMNKTTRNPLQINPVEASAPTHFVKSISRISNTSIHLRSSTAEVFSLSVNDWNRPRYSRIQAKETWLWFSSDLMVNGKQMCVHVQDTDVKTSRRSSVSENHQMFIQSIKCALKASGKLNRQVQ